MAISHIYKDACSLAQAKGLARVIYHEPALEVRFVRKAMGTTSFLTIRNPATGVMFHVGGGEPMDLSKLGQRIIRPAVEAVRLEWYGWHGFRRGIASNLYELARMKRSSSASFVTQSHT